MKYHSGVEIRMTEENEEKKPEPILEIMQRNLSLWAKMQEALQNVGVQYSHALVELLKSDSITRAILAQETMSIGLRTLQKQMTRQQEMTIRALGASPVIGAMVQFQQAIENLAKRYTEIANLSITKINIPTITRKIETIPHLTNRSVENLLKYIDVLERTLEAKEAELSMKDAEIKELRRQLEEIKEKLKIAYVS